MPVKVGMPRALFYYYYFPLWKAFLGNLGAEVVVSPPTSSRIVDGGVKFAVDEACLPVKVYYGHVLALKGRVDAVFTPRLASLEKEAFICPKFIGLPDMIRANIRGLPELIDVTFDLSRNPKQLERAVEAVGFIVGGCSKRSALAAWKEAEKEQARFLKLTHEGVMPSDAIRLLEEGVEPERPQPTGITIALMGHPYNLYDPHLNVNSIVSLQEMGVTVITPDLLPFEVTETQAAKLPKKMFWTMGKKLLGSALHYIDRSDVDGIIFIASFGCGPDSVIAELAERYVRRKRKIPFMLLTLDEHSGEAGVLTRLEAFVDMLSRRRVS